MSKDYHSEALKGTRETALNTIPIIQKELDRYRNSGHKDAQKHQIIYALNVLTTICQNSEALRETAHYDIYIDILIEVLMPKLEPHASPRHWKRILCSIEYIFLTLADHRMHPEAYKLHTYISKIQQMWSDTDDFQYLLSIHGSQLQMLIKQQQKDSNLEVIIKNRAVETFIALEKLFISMSAQCREKAMDCTELLNLFIRKIISKSVPIQIQLATTLQCEEMQSMYKEFFELMRVNSKFISSEEPSLKFQEHIQALYYFLQMDIHSKLKQQVAVQYARILRSLSIFEANAFMGYSSAILYNLLKLTCSQSPNGNFKETYSLLCMKFCQFLEQSGEELMQQLWFQDVVVFVCFLFHPMQPSNSSVFDIFWQQMDASLYILHIKLIAKLVKITPLISKLNLLQMSCCRNPNTWFHIQLLFNLIGLETYSQLLKYYREGETREEVLKSLSSIKTEISLFLQQSINTLISMEIEECTKSSVSVRKLCVSFARLLQESNQCTHAPDQLLLATKLTRLKNRISTEDWLMIMHRLKKNVLKCKDTSVATKILSCYIAELICNPTNADFILLRSLIQYHHSERPVRSLFETYLKLSSPFKPLLQENEKRYFHWLEVQYSHNFYDKEKHLEFFMIMANLSQTKYDFINGVHVGKILNIPATFQKVQKIYDTLMNKKRNTQNVGNTALTRLEEVTLAHTISLILSKRLQEQKVTLSSKDFHETNIPQLFQEKSLLSLSVIKEMETINMAREAVKAFEAFFNKADLEPLPMNDGSFLDWEHILEDLTSLALYFQLSGYLDYALEAWLLQYRISNTIDDIQSSLRSLAFFCEYNFFFEKDTCLQLSHELNSKNSLLLQIYENIKQLSTRQQNFTLVCVCQIAYYYASKKQLAQSETFLELVKDLHENKLHRQGKYDIVLFTADIVSFRILWKLVPSKKSDEPLKRNYCILKKIDSIIERLRTYINISSADMRPYTILLLNAIDEFAEFSAIHMCDNFLSGYLSTALRLCVEGGFAVRTVQLLCKWILINLQMEYLQKAEIKMQFVECILDLRDAQELASSLQAVKSCAMAASKELQNTEENGMHLMVSEEVRKVAVLTTPSPIKNNKNYIPPIALDHKLKNCYNSEENTEKTQRLSLVVLWSRFTLNCLRARLNFLSSENKDLHIFYENCEKWLQKRWNTFHFHIYQSIVLFCMLHHANFFRANRNYEKALQTLEKYIKHCTALEGLVDEAYLINFKLQLRDTKLEEIENKTRNLSIKKKNHTFDTLFSNKIKLTPAEIKYRTIAMTSHKKPSSSSTLKTADFVIYSDRKSPRKQQITLTKPIAAMKTLTFGKNSSESGSGSEKENVDKFPVIDISDTDSDCDVNIKKPTPKSILSTKKQSKFKFLESVELDDFQSPKIVETSKKKSIKTKRNQKTENFKDELPILVDEMQNLEIESISSKSKMDRTRRRSPRLSPKTFHVIDSVEDLSNAPTINTRSTRKRNTKQSKTPDASSITIPETATTGRRRLPARQARLENSSELPISTLSLRQRQRN